MLGPPTKVIKYFLAPPTATYQFLYVIDCSRPTSDCISILTTPYVSTYNIYLVHPSPIIFENGIARTKIMYEWMTLKNLQVHKYNIRTLIFLLSCVGYFSSSCSFTAAFPLNTSMVVPENTTASQLLSHFTNSWKSYSLFQNLA